MVDDKLDEIQVDAGQSAFWDNQEGIQAPPKTEVPVTHKKRRLVIVGGLTLMIILLITAALLPKQEPVKKAAAPPASAAPSPQPVLSGWAAEFAGVDDQLKAADLETMTAPPQTDMVVKF